MKILAALLALSALPLIAGPAGSTSSAPRLSGPATVNVAFAEDYDDPPFASRRWWELQDDRG